jgi:hypothetical protein
MAGAASVSVVSSGASSSIKSERSSHNQRGKGTWKWVAAGHAVAGLIQNNDRSVSHYSGTRKDGCQAEAPYV